MQTLNQTLYPLIFTRKSTRSFLHEPVGPKALAGLQQFLTTLVPLFEEEPFRCAVVPGKNGEYRLCGYTNGSALGNANLGFMLQQADLYLQSEGFGAVWYGMGRAPKEEKANFAPLSYTICLRFGVANGPSLRTAESQFNRLPLSQIAANPGPLAQVLNAARLAPSATNGQPWRFVVQPGLLHFYRRKPGAVAQKLFGAFNFVDMGIAACHATLALQHAGAAVTAALLPGAPTAPAGAEYSFTLQATGL